MFDLLDKPRIWIPVTWPGLVEGGAGEDDVAKVVEHRIDVYVELLEFDEAVEVMRRKDGEKATKYFARSFKRVATNWRKVKANGSPVPFSDENALRLAQVPGFMQGFEAAYLAALQGKLRTREGNSDASPEDGRADEA